MIWKSHLLGVVNIHWDAVIEKIEEKMGMRVIIIDYKGNVLASLCI
jgi:hypothetical protein